MLKYTIFAFVAFLALAASDDDVKFEQVVPEVVESVEAYSAKYPGSKIERLHPKIIANTTLMHYSFGRRNVPGSTFIASSHENLVLSKPTSFDFELKYPKDQISEGDFRTTFGEFYVDYGSLSGGAYVASGAVGLNYMKVIIEAKNAQYFHLDGYLYGIPLRK